MVIDGVEVTAVGLENFTAQEAKNYVEYVRSEVKTPLKAIKVTMCDDGKVDVSYLAKGEKFERIRRITGYLVGTTERWNDSKKSEEHERVKHNVLA
jgi:anaerobic ribonucleoside-triphosphate reductase